MKSQVLPSSLAAAVLMLLPQAPADTLFSADFSTEGDGFADHTTSTPPATGPATANGGSATNPEGRWVASYQTAPGSDTTANEFSVNSGVLRIQDWGGEARWESVTIDVSGYDTVDITAAGVTIDVAQNAGAEFFEYFYTLDGGADVITDVDLPGDPAGTPVDYSITGLDVSAASSLTVGFNFNVNGSNDGYEISTFTIEGTPTGGDVTPPAVNTLSPADDAIDTPTSGDLVITFNETVQALTGDITLHLAGDNSVVDTFDITTDATFSGNTVTLTPTAPLLNSTAYYILIPAAAIEDTTGNDFAGLTAATDWNFTTIAPDTTGPVIIATTPADDDTTVDPSTNLVITFDEPIGIGITGNVIVKKVSDGMAVATIDPFNGIIDGAEITLTLPQALDYSTDYYVEIDAGAFQDTLFNDFLGLAGTTDWNFTTQTAPAAPTVVINKYANISSGDKIELLVIGDETPGNTVDMRGMIVKDFSGSMNSDNGGGGEFTTDATWAAVPVGTQIIITAGTATSPDTDPTGDFVIDVGLDDTALFTDVGVNPLNIATTEMVMIKAAGSGFALTTGGIHALAAGTAGSQFTGFTGAKLIDSANTTGSNLGVIANNSTSAVGDFLGGDATGATPVGSMVFGAANNGANATYLSTLRGTVLGEGDGSAILANVTAGPYAGSGIFDDGQTGQSAEIELTATIGTVTLTDVEIDVPAEFGTPTTATLSGPGIGTNTVSVAGQKVTVSGAAITTTDFLVVTINGLSSPTPAMGNGNYPFAVSTAPSGGTPTALAASPTAKVIIPVSFLRGVDANGTAEFLGDTVAVEGVSTEQDFGIGGSNFSGFIQDATAGINIYSPVDDPGLIRGQRFAVIGTIAQFSGLTEIIPDQIIGFGPDTEPTPATLTVPGLLAAAETYEGSLVTVENLSYVSGTWAPNSSVTFENSGGNPLTIRIQSGSDATTPPASPVTITGIVGQFDSSSPRDSGYQLMPRDAADLVPGTVTNDFADWLSTNSYTATGFDTDTDSDGDSNGAEWYFFGSSPDAVSTNGSAISEVTSAGGGTFIFSHRRPTNRSGVTESYEYSLTLDGTWNPSDASVIITPGATVADGPGYEIVTVSVITDPPTTAKVFVRLALSEAP